MGLMVGPVELIRIRLQTQKGKVYSGPIDCIKKIYSAGGLRALYRGMGPTVGREGHGMGMYFLTYESLIHRDTSEGIKREDIPEWRLCLYGALYDKVGSMD
jgi:solute carrier family 25 (mitochondrial carnitine/acylcarnitine transporter), member 20/29